MTGIPLRRFPRTLEGQMSAQYDPDQLEIKYLHDMANLTGAHVLEIGCGDGRLTQHYAAAAGRVVGSDPNPERLATAQAGCPPALHPGLTFVQARAETLPFPRQTFDLVFLTWSL